MYKKFFCTKYLLLYRYWLLSVSFFLTGKLSAQLAIIDFDTPVVKETKADYRQKLYKSLVSGINRNLSLPLSDSTEENWMDAFYSVELLRYRLPWVENKLHEAGKAIQNRSGTFQHAFMECVYDAWPDVFIKEANWLIDSTNDVKCFALCAEYILRKNKEDAVVVKKIADRKNQYPENMVLSALWSHSIYTKQPFPPLKDLLHHAFFPKATIVFSFQRKNRSYPGIAIVRDSAGNFQKDKYGNIFSVPQLARSMSNVPGYISNGNTPQGIFRMHGFGVSKSNFIGPTQNIQLTMPGETRVNHFINDSSNTDSVWTRDWYWNMLPKSWRIYMPFYETFFAGMAGRTEIIAHGTTVDPSYYKGSLYYPLTPTLGCLCTKEIWDGETGKRKQSDQQKLVDALQQAGGADGYYVVVELNDEQRAVELNDLLPYLQ